MIAPTAREAGDRPGDPRAIALGVLERVSEAGAYADLALRAMLDRGGLAARDRALATELTYGVLRWRGHLDFLLGAVLRRPLADLEPRVRELLRLGAYQLAFSDRIPDPVAVSESVRLAHATGVGRAAGLVNATLRRLASERPALAPPALADDPLGHLVYGLSIPRWVAERWLAELGPEEAAALAAASNRPAPRTVRANRLRGDRDALLADLRARFPGAAPCRFAPDGVRLGGPGDPVRDPAFVTGRMTVQDEASQLVVELLDPQPGECVLDACAAPGAKTTAIAERVGPAGLVVAVDRHPRRLALVARDAARLGLAHVRTVHADATGALPEAPEADGYARVLVDAPCSGLGAWRRNPDARWRITADAPARLAAVQLAILRSAARRLAAGGVLVYSTCTLAREENQAVIDALLAERPDLRRSGSDSLPASLRAAGAPLVDERGTLRTLPHRHETDGFFAVRLERGASGPREEPA